MPTSTCQVCANPLDAGAAFCPRCGTPRGAQKPVDPMIGRTIIGQYVVKQRLGEGGMGAVYLAEQPSVGRQAVVKVMHPGLSADPGVAPRFEVEARAASQLSHPHIITIYNYGAMEDGTLFLAMEHVKGPSLEEVVADGPLPAGRVAAIGAQIADALGEAHRNGVIHRDLKPSNIMLARVGRQQDFAKVLDFGIAKVEGVKMTRTGSVIGTPQYMSPEQLRGSSIDGRSDLYSLGCILYQLISGELPFASDTAAGFMHKHLNEPVTSPALRNPEVVVPPNLDAVILRALAKDPSERFPDADTMARALEHCRDGAMVPLTAQSARASSQAVSGPRRRLGLWVALGSSLAVVTAGAATALWVYRHAEKTDAAAVAAAPKKASWKQVEPPREALPAAAKETMFDAGAMDRRSTDRARSKAVAKRPARRARRKPANLREAPAPTKPAPKRVALAMSRETEESDSAVLVPTPRGAPGKGSSRYKSMSADQLERELRRVIQTAKVPPSSVDTVFQSYQQAQGYWPADQREKNRRRWLVNLLVTYSKPSIQFGPSERKSLAQLRRIFMTMPTKANLSSEQRDRILASALGAYDKSSVAPKDRPFYKRMALLQMIKNMAVDPEQALR